MKLWNKLFKKEEKVVQEEEKVVKSQLYRYYGGRIHKKWVYSRKD